MANVTPNIPCRAIRILANVPLNTGQVEPVSPEKKEVHGEIAGTFSYESYHVFVIHVCRSVKSFMSGTGVEPHHARQPTKILNSN